MSPTLSRLRASLPFSSSTTPLQATTYLLGISLFSISFLVFLNSSISFVITDRLGHKQNVGDIVGTLGFVDELVALVACPVWGLVSDRVGVRNVAVAGYAIIGVALVVFVAADNVYPQLLMARVVFAVGASAAATMVTATLPSLTADPPPTDSTPLPSPDFNTTVFHPEDDEDEAAHYLSAPDVHENENEEPHSHSHRTRQPRHASRNSIADSLASDVTITPELFARSLSQQQHDPQYNGHSTGNGNGRPDSSRCPYTPDAPNQSKPAALAGFVGLFTGCGALLALICFLPLPARFGAIKGVTMAKAVEYSYYVVAFVSMLVAVFVGFGLRGLKGEEGKGWGVLFKSENKVFDTAAAALAGSTAYDSNSNDDDEHKGSSTSSYSSLLLTSLLLPRKSPLITLAYLGGFVARASTVAISLFVPLYVNSFFMENGFCNGSPNDPSPELKKECRKAYVLASILTGVAQLVGLICAPVFGYFSSRAGGRTVGATEVGGGMNYPVIIATLMGIIGYITFARLNSPELSDVDGRGGSPWVFATVALMGVSQIGAIVCSLGMLGKGVLEVDGHGDREAFYHSDVADEEVAASETSPLLLPAGVTEGEVRVTKTRTAGTNTHAQESRIKLKGSIAGVYSLCGGAAILLLTKVGGYLFDSLSRGAPFYMMAGFNGVLLVATVVVDGV